MATIEALQYQMPAELKAKLDSYMNPVSYADKSGTPGSATSNTATGRGAIAIGASAATITNSLVSAASIVHIQLESSDATATRAKCVPGAGSFVVTANANATAATVFSWYVVDAR